MVSAAGGTVFAWPNYPKAKPGAADVDLSQADCPSSERRTRERADEERTGSCARGSQETEIVQDYTHLRQEASANTPLPGTLQWAASLPPSVRPTALLRQYARIANLIAANWRSPGAFDDYMESLVTDKRGKRRGFPPDIMMELLALQRWHGTLRRGTSGLNVAGKHN